jgi:hypothetical protein
MLIPKTDKIKCTMNRETGGNKRTGTNATYTNFKFIILLE